MTKNKAIPRQPGTCPKCGCEDLKYDSIELEGTQVYYPFQCANEKCKFSGQEWYSLNFIEMTDEAGMTI